MHGQRIRRRQRQREHGAGRRQRHRIVAGTDFNRPGREIRRGAVQLLLARLAEAQVAGAGPGGEVFHRRRRLARIGRAEQREAGQRAHHGDVLHAVMRPAEVPVGQPRAHGDDGHGQAVVAHVVPDLLEAAQRGEIGDGVGEDVEALARQPRGHRRHVLLRDAGVEEPVRELRRERLDHRVAEGAHHEEQPRVRPRLGEQGVDEGGAQAPAEFAVTSPARPAGSDAPGSPPAGAPAGG